MKYMYPIIVFTFLCIFFSCKDNSICNWTVYNGEETGLKIKRESFNKILIEEETFYLFGTNNDLDFQKVNP